MQSRFCGGALIFSTLMRQRRLLNQSMHTGQPKSTSGMFSCEVFNPRENTGIGTINPVSRVRVSACGGAPNMLYR